MLFTITQHTMSDTTTNFSIKQLFQAILVDGDAELLQTQPKTVATIRRALIELRGRLSQMDMDIDALKRDAKTDLDAAIVGLLDCDHTRLEDSEWDAWVAQVHGSGVLLGIIEDYA